ncbi:hypothetical protein F7725_009712, partial [Dissostichus mawsoni]
MGQRFASSYANISEWEQKAMTKCTLLPFLYLCYLNDIIGIWPHPITSFPQFLDTLNNHLHSIKLNHNIHAEEISFLDTYQQHPQENKIHVHSSINPAPFTSPQTYSHRGYSKRFLRTIKNTTLASFAPARSTNFHLSKSLHNLLIQSSHNPHLKQIVQPTLPQKKSHSKYTQWSSLPCPRIFYPTHRKCHHHLHHLQKTLHWREWTFQTHPTQATPVCTILGRLTTPLVSHLQQHPHYHLVVSGLEANDDGPSGRGR